MRGIFFPCMRTNVYRIEKSPITIINIYAPTKDNDKAQTEFSDNLSDIIEQNSGTPLIIGGDFNTCLNPNMDTKGGSIESESNYKNKLLDLAEEYDLVDIWRLRNTEKKQYTWRGKGKAGLVQSRLDFFLISCSLEQQTRNIT